MHRINPNKKIITSVFRKNWSLLQKGYCGIDEVSFSRIANILNLEDTFSIASGFRILREQDLKKRFNGQKETFIPYVKQTSLYDLANLAQKVVKDTFPWLYSLRNKMPPEEFKIYESMNPFGRNLKDRLNLISESDEEKIKNELSGIVYNYMTEGQYERMNKEGLGGNPFRRVMVFLPYTKKKSSAEKITKRFSNEIARKMKNWDILTPQKAKPYLRDSPKAKQLSFRF